MALTSLEYRMLVVLSINGSRMLTNHQLLQRVWGPDKTDGFGPVPRRFDAPKPANLVTDSGGQLTPEMATVGSGQCAGQLGF